MKSNIRWNFRLKFSILFFFCFRKLQNYVYIELTHWQNISRKKNVSCVVGNVNWWKGNTWTKTAYKYANVIVYFDGCFHCFCFSPISFIILLANWHWYFVFCCLFILLHVLHYYCCCCLSLNSNILFPNVFSLFHLHGAAAATALWMNFFRWWYISERI